MATDLSFTSATELRRLIDEKQVSIVELVESFYRCIDDLNPQLHAYLTLCQDQALAAAKTIAEAGTGAVRFNPLFIHSNVGLGKTHLLQAIAAAASRHSRTPRVVYLTAEYFMWRFAPAIRDNDALSFKESLRNIDLLVIDDMQFLQGKSIQHEFCHLLNMLLDSARQVVVAADRLDACDRPLEPLDDPLGADIKPGPGHGFSSPLPSSLPRAKKTPELQTPKVFSPPVFSLVLFSSVPRATNS